MFKKVSIFLLSLAIVSTAASVAISQSEKKEDASKKEETKDKRKGDLYSQVELFSYALTTIQAEYVEEKEPQDLIYGSLKGMLSSLDPHSQFLEPEDYKDLKTETQGKFGGLGIEISMRDGLLTVITPIEDTPAWKAGIKAGDRIVKIDDETTKDLTLSDAVKKLRGEPGTDVHVTILREDEYKIHEFTITREVIHIQDVKDVHVIGDNIGYVRLTEFREDSYKAIHTSLEDLRAQGANALIFDLRNNPGGLLNVAIAIAEEMLPEGQVIVSTKGRHSAQDTVAKSENKSTEFSDWPVVVLINEGSASGSEIVAGAWKDNNRAIIVGQKSFGKGSVQSVIPLPDGSGLRLTTSKYFTPSGVCIHGIGIEPDIVVEREEVVAEDEEDDSKDEAKNRKKKIEEKKKEVEKVFEDVEKQTKHEEPTDPNELEKVKKIKDRDERLAKDTQVQAAINVIKGVRTYKNFGKLREAPPVTEEKAAE